MQIQHYIFLKYWDVSLHKSGPGLSPFYVRWSDAASITEKHSKIKKIISGRNCKKCYFNKEVIEVYYPARSFKGPSELLLLLFCFEWLTCLSTRFSFLKHIFVSYIDVHEPHLNFCSEEVYAHFINCVSANQLNSFNMLRIFTK